jgi:hypothetical protein
LWFDSLGETVMQTLRVASIGLALLLVGGCANGDDTLQATAPSAVRTLASERSLSAAAPVQTTGHFDAIVDFSTVTLTPRGENCLLQVDGRLVFTGTIVGTATGHTSALEFAPCDQVALHPPGTFPDVFRSVATFDGTIAGLPAHSDLLYMGRVQVGGAIDGRLVFSKGVAGELDVNSIVAVGGTYSGSLVVR